MGISLGNEENAQTLDYCNVYTTVNWLKIIELYT